jgi:hypothetical protein
LWPLLNVLSGRMYMDWNDKLVMCGFIISAIGLSTLVLGVVTGAIRLLLK